jgi:hypothetical protein
MADPDMEFVGEPQGQPQGPKLPQYIASPPVFEAFGPDPRGSVNMAKAQHDARMAAKLLYYVLGANQGQRSPARADPGTPRDPATVDTRPTGEIQYTGSSPGIPPAPGTVRPGFVPDYQSDPSRGHGGIRHDGKR